MVANHSSGVTMSATQQVAAPASTYQRLRELLPDISKSGYTLEQMQENVVKLRPNWFDSEGCHALLLKLQENGDNPYFLVHEGLYKDIKEYADEKTHMGWAWNEEAELWGQKELPEKLNAKLAEFAKAPPPKLERILAGLEEGSDIAFNGTISLAIIFTVIAGGMHVYKTNFKNDNKAITAPAKPDSGPAVAP